MAEEYYLHGRHLNNKTHKNYKDSHEKNPVCAFLNSEGNTE